MSTRKISHRERDRKLPYHRKTDALYLAAPKSEYDLPRYTRLLTRVCTLFANCTLVEAKTAYRSIAEWRAKWPLVLDSIDGLVFLSTEDGWIGRGVWTEIEAAWWRGLPVWYLTDAGRLVLYLDVMCSTPDPDNWTHHVRVSVESEA